MPRKPKTFKAGDLVRYTAKFRRSIGMVTGGPVDGVVVGHETALKYPIVLWSDRDLPTAVAPTNIETKRTKRSRQELLQHARMATGVPFGQKSDAYQIYTRKRGAFKERATVKRKEEAIQRATSIYDGEGHDTILLDLDGAALLSLDAAYSAARNPRRKSANVFDLLPEERELLLEIASYEWVEGPSEGFEISAHDWSTAENLAGFGLLEYAEGDDYAYLTDEGRAEGMKILGMMRTKRKKLSKKKAKKKTKKKTAKRTTKKKAPRKTAKKIATAKRTTPDSPRVRMLLKRKRSVEKQIETLVKQRRAARLKKRTEEVAELTEDRWDLEQRLTDIEDELFDLGVTPNPAWIYQDLGRAIANFKAALKAADRELTAAVEQTERGNLGSGIHHLVHAGYWTGRARAERDYSGRIDIHTDRRLRELEDGMKEWGKNLQDWMRREAG